MSITNYGPVVPLNSIMSSMTRLKYLINVSVLEIIISGLMGCMILNHSFYSEKQVMLILLDSLTIIFFGIKCRNMGTGYDHTFKKIKYPVIFKLC